MIQHTRSLRRRFSATLIDYLVLVFVSAVLSMFFAASLASNYRGGVGLFNFNVCNTGEIFDESGRKISLTGWDGVKICDLKVDFVFPYRTATVFKVTTENRNGVNYTFTQYLSYQLNEKNQIVYPTSTGPYHFLVFFPIIVLLEKLFGRTPGKKLLGLEVISMQGSRPSWLSAIIRNLIKYLAIVLWSVWTIAATPAVEALLRKSVLPNGTIVMPIEATAITTPFSSQWWGLVAISAVGSLVLLAIPLSMFFPWSKAGRGIHDRLARTLVLRNE